MEVSKDVGIMQDERGWQIGRYKKLVAKDAEFSPMNDNNSWHGGLTVILAPIMGGENGGWRSQRMQAQCRIKVPKRNHTNKANVVCNGQVREASGDKGCGRSRHGVMTQHARVKVYQIADSTTRQHKRTMRQDRATTAKHIMAGIEEQHKLKSITKAFPLDTTALEVADSTMDAVVKQHAALSNTQADPGLSFLVAKARAIAHSLLERDRQLNLSATTPQSNDAT